MKAKSTTNDLVYIFWVDHGTDQLFNLHNYETITHAEYNDCIKNIAANVIIGAYNPCYSGAVIPHISRPGVISITSQDASHENRAGWAGWWRTALAGGTSGDPSDKNGDGQVDMAEAFEWVAPKSKAYSPPEHPLFDDNGDGVGSEYGTAGYSRNDPSKDGFLGKMYSLTAWSSRALMATVRIQYHVSTISTTVASTTATATSTKPTILTESGPGTITRTVERTATTGAAPRTITRTSTLYTSTWTWTETRRSYSMYTIQSTTTTLSKTSSSTGVTSITTEGTVYEMPLIVEYVLMRITYIILVQVSAFAQLVRHIFTGPVVQVEITEYKGRYYGPPPPEPTLLDMFIENVPLIVAAVVSIIAASIFVMKKWGAKLSSIRQWLTRLRKKNSGN